ncbi:sulfite exporter TauE/SafE family protein [Nitrosomonas sp.]|uniref:sulfite exporter TauE/SafE family protein n=1 Tax=Nitrosomonas sp. TaxID=42353 RepID=UPI001D5146A1|nr:sulfite exporter TauE/SafE family protein [Nitrosomonas sp.]MCB1950242.1 sulfite exporter TauE/SafE family protein [Nitrosomonas sp.]MCP5243941.1 sulfite exporter TauE/SafE family protein [Burkholderiales bacterium]MDR4513425.1 sulfite exporter TauE/SafE family protein [Nitrosomonas sp.]
MEWWLMYLLLGAVVGFFAGLLGIGGGLIIVPALTFMFTAQDFPPDRILHLALGTAMATIIFTSAASLYTHHKHAAVNWTIFKSMTPGIIIGTLTGTVLAGALTTQILHIIFTLFICYAATSMLLKLISKSKFDKKTNSDFNQSYQTFPKKASFLTAGGVIGAVSSLIAIGGGILTVPFLTLCNIRLQHAIGTAAAIGFPIALAGTIGYIANGLAQAQQLPPSSLGYVYLPALGWLILASMLTAPLGAKTTHSAQTHTLTKLFIVLLYSLAGKMLFDLFM